MSSACSPANSAQNRGNFEMSVWLLFLNCLTLPLSMVFPTSPLHQRRSHNFVGDTSELRLCRPLSKIARWTETCTAHFVLSGVVDLKMTSGPLKGLVFGGARLEVALEVMGFVLLCILS
ncbi:hypothetical protein M758_UG218200 [Ceratodon purpureus]|nr:hypothetical protein M758_UG218200 [Ceratodon purpureus]